MNGFKLTCWNVEWLIDDFDVFTGAVAPGARRGTRRMPTMAHATAKLEALKRMVEEMDPDILLLVEAHNKPAKMQDFVAQFLPGLRLVMRDGQPDSAYAIKGEQWIWFAVKPAILTQRRAHLLDVATWQAYTRVTYLDQESRKQHKDGQWWVSVPKLDSASKTVGANVLTAHSHHRHPQVLVVDWDGMRVEFVGAHLKSKFTGSSVPRRQPNETDKAYYTRPDVVFFMAQAAIARAKLTTEATDIRHYIDQRFSQEPLPAIFVLGDLNDGPGKELLEREYLLHDLISSLQGDVFFARRFLNHALFDNPDHLRWTARFVDKLDLRRDPHILLDHIVFTEALSRRGIGPLIVDANMGKVEHEIHERIESLMPAGVKASDHRPVSLFVSKR